MFLLGSFWETSSVNQPFGCTGGVLASPHNHPGLRQSDTEICTCCYDLIRQHQWRLLKQHSWNKLVVEPTPLKKICSSSWIISLHQASFVRRSKFFKSPFWGQYLLTPNGIWWFRWHFVSGWFLKRVNYTAFSWWYIMTSWWLNQPLWKIWSSKWEYSPNRGQSKKYWKPPPSHDKLECTMTGLWKSDELLFRLVVVCCDTNWFAPAWNIMCPCGKGICGLYKMCQGNFTFPRIVLAGQFFQTWGIAGLCKPGQAKFKNNLTKISYT